jgi:hypothetical protein
MYDGAGAPLPENPPVPNVRTGGQLPGWPFAPIVQSGMGGGEDIVGEGDAGGVAGDII